MQHASLTTERWAAFAPEERLLMIANELNRASARMGPEDGRSRRLSYERALRLTDLTIQLADRPGLRRELLRWRDLLAELYLAEEPRAETHRDVLRALLLLSPITATQLSILG